MARAQGFVLGHVISCLNIPRYQFGDRVTHVTTSNGSFFAIPVLSARVSRFLSLFTFRVFILIDNSLSFSQWCAKANGITEHSQSGRNNYSCRAANANATTDTRTPKPRQQQPLVPRSRCKFYHSQLCARATLQTYRAEMCNFCIPVAARCPLHALSACVSLLCEWLRCAGAQVCSCGCFVVVAAFPLFAEYAVI